MKPFKAPLDDILFSLTHVAGAEALPGWDRDLCGEIGGHFAALAEEVVAPLNAPGDVQGCRLKDGRVVLPDGFAEAYRDYAEAGWPGLSAPEEFGGQGLGAVVHAVTSEIFSGANHALQMVTGLVPGAIRILMAHGSADQKSRYIPAMASGEMLATMCLTEPGAGSDLARIRTAASQTNEGWRIEGEKIFISGGDQNLTDRILHLVLARTSAEGTRGLSLFLCPSHRGDGSRNSVRVARIEDKMGLHASPTCHMIFDAAEAELIGEEGRGLAAMFILMNHARVDVALQGVAHAARAHDIALAHATERRQGRLADGAEARLIDHPEVRDMVAQADALAVLTRAMVHITLVEIEKAETPALVDFLTPVVKVAGSEAGIRAAELGQQVLGGYGYLHDYGVEQVYRDARITAIYEGANSVHARALAARHAPGAAGDAFAAYLAREMEAQPGDALRSAIEDWTRERANVLGAGDAPASGQPFMRASVRAFRAVVAGRMWQSMSVHPDPDRLRRAFSMLDDLPA